MSKKQALVIGCGGVIVVFGIVLIALVAWIWHVAQDPPDVAISVESPTTVSVGQEFTLSVVIENQREERAFQLTDIDIADEYLKSFLVIGENPHAESSTHIPIDNTRSFSFNQAVPPREVMRFDFTLRPTAPGLYRGDVDVCEGQRFLSTLLQTEVRSDK